MHVEHTAYSRIVLCRGACGDVGCVLKPKLRENMMEAGKGGWRGCCAPLGRLRRLVELGGHVIDGWEEWGAGEVRWTALAQELWEQDCRSELG